MTLPHFFVNMPKATGCAVRPGLLSSSCRQIQTFSKHSFLGLACTLALSMPLHAAGLLAETLPSLIQPQPVANSALEALRSLDLTERNYTIQPGETFLSLYGKLGAKDPAALDFIRKHAELRPLTIPQPGQFVSAGLYADGRFAYLRMYMEGPHDRDNRMLELRRDNNTLEANAIPFTFDTIEEVTSGKINGSLAKAAKDLNLPDHVVEEMLSVWEGDDNPLAKLHRGDLLQVVYERKFADGHFVRNGHLLGIRITRGAQTHEAFWLPELESYYTASGQSVRQTFLRVPLEVKEVSSEFSPMRRHPITGKLRPHNGTDFRAPKGSRIFAAADGVVSFVGFQRRGYGRYIKIDHGQNRETVYAHMSKTQPGIAVGQKVKRGQVIGYVGRTGLATGNHLHYELVINGVQINPLTADLPDTANLTNAQMAKLKAIANPLQERFTMLAKAEAGPNRPSLVGNAALSGEIKFDRGFRSSFPARSIIRTNLAQQRPEQP